MRHVGTAIGHTIPHRSRCAARATALFALALVVASSNALAQTSERDSHADDPFRNGSWQLELTGHGALETWNYNISHEEMYGTFAGLSYGLRDGLAFTVTAPLYYVEQRGIDGWVLGATFGIRGRVYRRSASFLVTSMRRILPSRLSVFWAFDVGVS